MKTKLISAGGIQIFENTLNEFLSSIPDHCIVDIKYSGCDHSNKALVLYNDPDKMKRITTAH